MLNYWLIARPLAVLLLFLSALVAPAHAARDGSTDRPGLDYRSFELSAPNPDLCENACKKERQCRAWTYAWPGAKGPKAMCSLKTGVPPKRSDTCCISGVMATSSPITQTDDPKPGSAPVPPKASQQANPSPAPSNRADVLPKPKPPLPQPVPQDQARLEPAPEPEPTPNSEQQQPELSAEKVAACRDYASRAIAQNRENDELRCGLAGSRWGFDYDVYFNYCAKSPASAYQSARSARGRELEQCKSRIAARRDDDDAIVLPEVDIDLGDLFNGGIREERFCRTFAAQSVRQANEARELDCGFGGRQWSASRVRQARLCERIGPREATRLLNARARQLDRCRADAGGGGFAARGLGNCRDYAQESVRQARIARRLGCGLTGPRWTTSYRAHLRWCRQVPFREVTAEVRVRDRLLARCE